MNLHEFSDVTQTEINTAQPLMFEPIAFEFVMTIGQTKSHKLSAVNQFIAEFIKQDVGQFFLRSVNVHNIGQQKHIIL